MRPPKLTPEDIKKILEISATGISQSEIARKFSVDRSTIAYYLSRAGKAVRPKIDYDKIIQLYREGKHFREIAETLKCNPMTVSGHVKASKYYDPARKSLRRVFAKTAAKIGSKTYLYAAYQKKELKRIVKQIRCAHPSFKCGKCGKWYDNAREQIVPHDRPDC